MMSDEYSSDESDEILDCIDEKSRLLREERDAVCCEINEVQLPSHAAHKSPPAHAINRHICN